MGRVSRPVQIDAAGPLPVARCAQRLLTRCAHRLGRVHHDQQGTISIVSVFAILIFTMLLGMVINVGRHVDEKLRMQNAADAATYSSGLVLARGMNAIAFTNHLLSDVFAITAEMREARDRNAEQLVPEILNAWTTIGPIFSRATFPKFQALGDAITQKVPLEQDLVDTYGEMSAAVSDLVLPVFHHILGEPGIDGNPQTHLIPEFQRALVRTVPALAQAVMGEMAQRHSGPATSNNTSSTSGSSTSANSMMRPPMAAVLWRTRALPVGAPNENDPRERTLPAYDPSPSGPDYNTPPPINGNVQQLQTQYLINAVGTRNDLARRYLEDWTRDFLGIFDSDGKMSQFANLWRVFTCAQLNVLLTQEYPVTNLPHMISLTDSGSDTQTLRSQGTTADMNRYLDEHFTFVGVVYRQQMPEMFPGLFRNRTQGDSIAFSQVSLYIPRARMWLSHVYQGSGQGDPNVRGGTLGINVPLGPNIVTPSTGNPVRDIWIRESWPMSWDLFNQHWTIRLVPSTTPNLAQILQTPPPSQFAPNIQMPNLGSLSTYDITHMNSH